MSSSAPIRVPLADQSRRSSETRSPRIALSVSLRLGFCLHRPSTATGPASSRSWTSDSVSKRGSPSRTGWRRAVSQGLRSHLEYSDTDGARLRPFPSVNRQKVSEPSLVDNPGRLLTSRSNPLSRAIQMLPSAPGSAPLIRGAIPRTKVRNRWLFRSSHSHEAAKLTMINAAHGARKRTGITGTTAATYARIRKSTSATRALDSRLLLRSRRVR